MKCIKRARSNAADNPNRGMLIVLRGATFDLAVRSETVVDPSILTIRRYTAAAKVAVEVSKNP